MRNIVSEITTEDNIEIKTLDYSRLTSIVWTVCQNLNDIIKVLENP